MSTISHLDDWIFVQPLKLRIFFSLSTIYEVVCVGGFEHIYVLQKLTDLCVVLQLSALEGRGNQNEECLAERTYWYATDSQKKIYWLIH